MSVDPSQDDGLWSLGDYSLLARQLAPAAAETVSAAAPVAGELVLDLGCGTGNASALCVGRGARVVGVDPARRLLEVAARRVPEAEFRFGDAGSIPVADGSVDLVVSVFGVIFAPDPGAAASEITRVLAPSGRLVLSAWLPDNALAEVAQMRREEVGGGIPSLVWQDPDALAALLGPDRFLVTASDRPLAFTDASTEAFLASELAHAPPWVAARRQLDHDSFERIRERALEIFTTRNEDPAGFRVTSGYRILTASRC